MAAATNMTYRFLGDSGLLVSKLALGSWMYPDQAHTIDAWYDMMKIAFAQGVNFFDSAENYALGQADVLMGGAINKGISEGLWSREDLVVTAKIFSGTKGFRNGTPNSQGLNRKHLIEGTQAALKRMGLDYVDVIFCHHPEPCTPIEETVRAMNYIIEQGWAIGARATDQRAPSSKRYNIFSRDRVEFEFTTLYKRYKVGVTAWSPLAFGTLTGKYTADVPEGSRFTMEPIKKSMFGGETFTKNMSLAWCLSNEHVATVLIGASKTSQLEENLKALAVVDKITPEVKAEIDAIVQYVPSQPWVDHLQDIRMRHL
ncbi:hypothetical protein F443_03328 [Phytophthora nicotianae P1569]|uniref:NADP-dependent oxidoreductase domain-containing protein n=1 Tax=Phytophthora nicotianae P1569 TaxID=1317065 RepID=V9FRS1_PHYNI|nr:hypothetical protein F443_03328 [Phytophthora nicotianae P1569]